MEFCKKCVVVGDAGVDKTGLFTSDCPKNPFLELDYNRPTVFVKRQILGLITDKGVCNLAFTACKENYDRERHISYPGTKVFIVAFSVVSPSSFENAKEKWVPEIREYAANTPFLLVGINIEQRSDPEVIQRLATNKQKPITKEQGKNLAKELQAVKYLECSVVTKEGVNKVFAEAANAALMPKDQPEKQEVQTRCIIS